MEGKEQESERSDFQCVLTTFFLIFFCFPTSIHRAAVSQRSIVVAGCREKLDTTQDVKAKMETHYSLVFLSFSKKKKGEHYPKLCFSLAPQRREEEGKEEEEEKKKKKKTKE